MIKYEPRQADREILRCLVGSQAYGTATAGSDEDFKGIFVPPRSSLIGVKPQKPTITHSQDDVSYSLRHFVSLSMRCSPNILELLYCDTDHIMVSSDEGNELRKNRDLFLTKQCIKPYVNYAKEQLMLASKKPQNRGRGRTELIEQFGYDTKFALHTIRLLESAIEILRDGTLIVTRPNAKELIAIKDGSRFAGFDEFSQYAQKLIEDLKQLEDKTTLPESPNIEAINDLTVNLHLNFWKRHPD